ncbi:MAG: hypothetical protein K2Q18_15360, partial [Bdellovibrionales bacterium]|nr:hypothetical protein [Bdellovibrionales bacterium]
MSSRKPASSSEDENFKVLVKSMVDFKNRIMGSEKDSSCTPEQLEADFNKLMASTRRTSCSVNNFTFDRDEFEEKSCP